MKFTHLQQFAIWVLPVLFAITLHEVAHGWVASLRGDPTAKTLGRLTINPFKHIDLIGTVIVPAFLFFFGGFIFGWAKPVPVDWHRLKHPRLDMAIVALAGPFANFLMALGWAVFGKLGTTVPGDPGLLMFYMGKAGIFINIMLMVLNLIPIPPLDGSRVFTSFLPRKATPYLALLEPFGFIILLLLLMTGILGAFLIPIIHYLDMIIQAWVKL